MKRWFAVLSAIYVVFMLYNLQMYIWGEQGLLAYQDLENYKQKLEENLESLDIVHENLKGEFESLKGNTETIALYARELGYYQEKERQIIIEQMDLEQSHYVVGEIVKPYRRKRVDNRLFGIVAVLFGVTAYLMLRFKEGL